MASKSLGTLTLDLVAKVAGFEQGMDKASRKSKKTSAQIEKHANSIAKAMAGISVAAATGLTALVSKTAESARETKNLAAIAGASTQQFQRLTYAASRYGIEQGKVSDILKDTNDRVGDFIQTGGGPMLDFFENIAPKVGVTADEFARLSGPEALQLYVSSLEKAGVSQKDMTFYMEAIASDATALIPLLRDNGKALNQLGDEAERTGNVLTDLEFAELEKITKSTDELRASLKGVSNDVVLAAIPAINDLTDLLGDQGTIDAAQSLGNAVVSSINGAVRAIDGAIKVTQFLAEELAAITAGAAADDIVRLEDELDTLYSMLDNPTNRIRFFGKDGAIVYYDKDEIEQMIADTEIKIVNARKRLEQDSRAAPAIDLVKPSDVSAPTSGRPKSGGLPPLPPPVGGDEGEDYSDRVASIRQAFETEKQEALRIFGERNEEIAALYEADAISKMEADNLKIQSEMQMQERLKEIRQSAIDEEATLQQQRQALILGGAESLFGSLADLTGTFAGEQTALYKTMFAVQKAAAIAQSIVAIQTGIAQAAAVPWPTNLAAMASVASATAGIIGNITSVGLNLSGQAHDGIMSVPSDGTWNLEKGERVLPSDTAARLDAQLSRIERGGGGTVVNINGAPPGTRTEQRTDSQGNQMIDVLLGDVATGGPFSRAMQSTYALKRQGR